ncbi:MAG: DUF433 domain-containing protein [Methylococcales bacterium]
MTKSSVVHSDPDILGGTPVFVGTRVPIQRLSIILRAVIPWRSSLMTFQRSLATLRLQPSNRRKPI